MPSLFLEALGRLSDLPTINFEEEDLHSVFLQRSELMGWGTAASSNRRLLWVMEEAELTAHSDAQRIGWAQVGISIGPDRLPGLLTTWRGGWFGSPEGPMSLDPVVSLPPLAQCLCDSLSRFGLVELSGFQVTGSSIRAVKGDSLGYLVSGLGWFNTDLQSSAEAVVSLEQGLLGDRDLSELVSSLRRRYTGRFEFRPAGDLSHDHVVRVSAGEHFQAASPPLDEGLLVAMPEWTPSAAGWVLASILDAARSIEPGVTSFAIRVTRLR